MKPALLVIDFINDIAHPKGKIARSADRIQKNQIIEHANQAIKFAREQKWLIIFIKVGFSTNYAECPKTSPLFGKAPENKALLLGAWGTEFVENLDCRAGDLILVKTRVSSFYGTSLEPILRANAITHLVISGTATNMTVEHTARDAHDRDYSVIILEDACEGATHEAHQAALESMSRIAKIIPTKDLESVKNQENIGV
jgi:nicotinamidase-related amidase